MPSPGEFTMTEFLFLDLDDTILDFGKAEKAALTKTLGQFGVEPTERVCTRYSQINRSHWERLERREITRQQVLTGRFQVLFEELGRQADPCKLAESYEANLSMGHDFLPGAEQALEQLVKTHKLYIASNGTARVQYARIESARLARFFEGIFISEELGADKPSRAFFEACFSKIPGFDPQKAMIVGDSLTSDILGGQNAGIRTCWVNPSHKPRKEGIRVDYEIETLGQLEGLLEKIG